MGKKSSKKKLSKRERRRRAILRRRLLIAGMALFLLLLILGIRFIVGNIHKAKKKTAVETTEKISADAGKQTVKDAALTLSQGIKKQAEEEIPKGSVDAEGNVTSIYIENTPIENIDSLDNTVSGWGMGEARDEKNRPTEALEMQEKYGEKYQAYFIGEDTDPPLIYLTFDLGYEGGYTAETLDILKEKDVSAVFFIVGYYAQSAPELVERMIAEGHELGNHAMTHPSDAEGMVAITEDDIMDLHKYILEKFDYTMHLFRFPSGNWSERGMAIANNCNYKSVFYSSFYYDYNVNEQMEPSAALKLLLDDLHPGAIYLLHLSGSTNTQILGDFIDQAREKGYEFALLQ